MAGVQTKERAATAGDTGTVAAAETGAAVALAKRAKTNPFVDVAMMLFLEDIAEKQGVEGVHDYMINQGTALAQSMPAEDYATWDDFVRAVNQARSIFTALEGMEYVAGYALATPVCPFYEAIETYIRTVGELLPFHQQVTDYYNMKVMNAAVESFCLIHQSFRREVVKRIRVAGKPVRYAQMSCKGYNSEIKNCPDDWLNLLIEKAGITQTQIAMINRTYACLVVLYPPMEAATTVTQGGGVTEAKELKVEESAAQQAR